MSTSIESRQGSRESSPSALYQNLFVSTNCSNSNPFVTFERYSISHWLKQVDELEPSNMDEITENDTFGVSKAQSAHGNAHNELQLQLQLHQTNQSWSIEAHKNTQTQDIENQPITCTLPIVDRTYFPRRTENGEENASDVDTKANFSFEAIGEDDVSTLGDTFAGSTDGRNFVVKPPINEYGYPSMELPLRSFHPEQTKGNGANTPMIQLVPTEDTSQGSPKEDFKAEVSNHEGKTNWRRTIFLLSLIMVPILLGTLFVLVFMLIRLRQEDDMATSATLGASSFPIVGEKSKDPTFFPTASPTNSSFSTENRITSTPTLQATEQPAPTTISSTLAPVFVDAPTTATLSPTNAPTPSPFSMSIVAISLFPTKTPTLNPTMVVTEPPATPQPTFLPTTTNTEMTTASATDSLTMGETILSETSLPASDQPPYPNLRFVRWGDFTANADSGLQFAVTTGLGYDQFTWNNPGTADIESLTFETIVTQDAMLTTALVILGFDTSTKWNCWMNHYFDFDWDELTKLPAASEAQESRDFVDNDSMYGLQVQLAWETLGWTSFTWNSQDSSLWPASESKSWDQLTVAEQEAADTLCFTRNLWDEVSIPNW